MANFLYFRNYIRFFNSTFDQKFDTANSIRNLHVNVQEITILVSNYVVFFSLFLTFGVQNGTLNYFQFQF